MPRKTPEQLAQSERDARLHNAAYFAGLGDRGPVDRFLALYPDAVRDGATVTPFVANAYAFWAARRAKGY